MNFFDIDNIFFTLWNYEVSYLEFFGLVSGIVAVVLSALAHVWSWPIGIINVTLSFFLFFQVQLYPDMFLQVFFFVTNVIGWWRWTHPKPFEEDRKHELRVSFMKSTELLLVCVTGIAGTLLFGYFAQNLHHLLKIGGLEETHFYYSALGDFYLAINDPKNSMEAYDKALSLASSNVEKALIRKKKMQLP